MVLLIFSDRVKGRHARRGSQPQLAQAPIQRSLTHSQLLGQFTARTFKGLECLCQLAKVILFSSLRLPCRGIVMLHIVG